MQSVMVAERDTAFLSLELTRIDVGMSIPDFRDIDTYGVSQVLTRRELRDFFRDQEFHSLLRQLPESLDG